MHGILLDIGLGAGLAAACGLRPFLPLLLSGGLGAHDALGVSFPAGEPFHFLQSSWWLVVVAVMFVLAYALQLALHLDPTLDPSVRAQRVEPLAAALAGLSLGAGAVLFGGTLAAHHDVWWPGVVGGLAAAALAERVAGPVIVGARRRLADRAAREALTIYLDVAALIAAAFVALLHPLGYVLIALLAWFSWRQRSRSSEKYAGLRILRR